MNNPIAGIGLNSSICTNPSGYPLTCIGESLS